MIRWLLLLLLFPSLLQAQKMPSIAEKTKGLKAYEGFYKYFWNDTTGKIYLQINRLDSEVLYQTSLAAGLGSNDIGLDRGLLGHTYIVKFSRVANKLLMVQPNYHYRAVTNNAAEKRAVAESFAESTIWGFTIEAATNDSFLVDATAFFMRDAINIHNVLSTNKQGNYSLDASRSVMYLPHTRNFPLNSEFETSLTFTNSDGQAGNYVASVSPSTEAITLRIHHSFVQLPDNHYQPRLYDARSPYFTNQYYDYSTPVSEPLIKYFICRHRLEKKNPMAVKSEPVNPIIYYLDNGTPEPIRSALLEGASWWNQAFEAAGFINAFQVKILPDSADPMDIRYNMINWVHRSTRGWSYGDAVVDPRTGEIIKGNVTLGSLRVRQDYLIAQGLLSPFKDSSSADARMMAMALQRLKQLAAHEVGHTLGLMHNYISSSQNRASVMDYPPPVAMLNEHGEIDLSNAYTNQIGEWDKVSIAYGYSEFAPGTNEASALSNILTEAQQRGLTFISDRDARAAGGLHPNAHLWDQDKDPTAGLTAVMKVRQKALENFGEQSIKQGTPMAMLEDVLVPIYMYHRYQVEAAIKEIGGMYYTYAIKGDGQTATAIVPKEDQVKALNAVAACMDPSFLSLPKNIVQMIPPRPAEYDYNRELFERRTGIAFDPLAIAETAADLPLSFLFNVERLNRMEEYHALFGGLGVDEMVNTLMDKTWNASAPTDFEALILRQNQQLLLTYFLYVSQSDAASFATKSQMFKAINTLKEMVQKQVKKTKDDNYKGYLLLTLNRIKNTDKLKPTIHIDPPPGSPIGCDIY